MSDDQGDVFNLQRFITAQDPVIDTVREELAAGSKRTHWMWYIFPQITGLGLSSMSQFYAISSQAEARAYLAHPILGPRLRDCTQLVLDCGRQPLEIFGPVDAQKFLSCLTLFGVTTNERPFTVALDVFYGGWYDQATLTILQRLG